MKVQQFRRAFFLLCGFSAVILATIGVVVPLLPTTPFLIIAVACFSRSSKSLQRWLFRNRILGTTLLDWENHGAISLHIKIIAKRGYN